MNVNPSSSTDSQPAGSSTGVDARATLGSRKLVAVTLTGTSPTSSHTVPYCRSTDSPIITTSTVRGPMTCDTTLAPATGKVASFSRRQRMRASRSLERDGMVSTFSSTRSEEHTSELQSQSNLVCRLLLETNHDRLN